MKDWHNAYMNIIEPSTGHFYGPQYEEVDI